MAEAAAVEQVVETPVDGAEQTQVEYTALEKQAMADGWRPQEEWEGDPDSWKDAKSFIRDGEFFKKIEEVKRENKNLRKTVSTMKTHYERVRETEYQRALATLKEQKKMALREGDTDLAVDLDDQIDAKRAELEQARQIEAMSQAEPEVHPEFQSWVNRNKWYENNPEVREFADNAGMAYKKTHMAASPQQVLQYVEERVAKGYPELFKNPRKSAPNAVEGGQGPRKGHDTFQLTDMEKQIMTKLVRSKLLTEEQYINDLKELDKQGKR